MQEIKYTNSYEILTEDGFKDFDGIVKSNKETVKILFTDGSNIITSTTHRFKTDVGYKKSEEYVVGDYIQNREIYSIEKHGVIEVFDPLNVDGDEYISNNLISHNCSFLGSSLTLIDAQTLFKLIPKPYIYSKDGFDVLESPIPKHTYAMVCDTSKGLSKDYSASVVVDITAIPYKIVAKYRNNTISPLLYPNIIYKIAKEYNDASVLIENNSSEQVGHILQQDLEYENILYVNKGKHGQQLGSGFGSSAKLGVTTDKKVKRIGCSNLKNLIEEGKFLIEDQTAISELSTFIERKGSYAADDGYNDDIVMCMVLFSWCVTQEYFKDLMNMDLRKIMFDERMKQIEDEMTPIGFFNDGREDEEIIVANF